ncbi:hypothetical protein Tco_0987894, partial [Tanacetum coccineum]
TCITGSTIESEFMALAAAGKEAEWLKNLLLEIPLWFKPITPISIRCDSAATLAKAYSQMIRELITNEVISIEFVRMCLEPADKEDEVVNFLMVNFFEKMLSRSMNKEKPPMIGHWVYANVGYIILSLELQIRNPAFLCAFVFWFYVIEPNNSVSINSIIESMDVIFNENRLSSVPRLSLRIPNRTKDIGGSVVPEEVTE